MSRPNQFMGNVPYHPQYGNRLVQGYQQHINSSIPFQNNQLLYNNPAFRNAMSNGNHQLYQRMKMMKMEYNQKYKSVRDTNMSPEELTNYVINPIKVTKPESPAELNGNYFSKTTEYVKPNAKNKIKVNEEGIIVSEEVPDYIKNLWANRKNTPYKNILKNEDYTKNFTIKNFKKEIVVHKVTKLDKDVIRLAKEFEEIKVFVKEHNEQLKLIYSETDKEKWKAKFDYVNLYKHRVKYDPKDYNELKKFHREEQAKIDGNNKRIDAMIELLLAGDDLTPEERAAIEGKGPMLTIKNEPEDEDFNATKTAPTSYEDQLRSSLKKELGDDYEKVMKEYGLDEEKHQETKVKITKKSNSENNEYVKPKGKIRIKKKEDKEETTEVVEDVKPKITIKKKAKQENA